MNNQNQGFSGQNQAENQNHSESHNQSMDYDSWVNSLGNIQDGIFQNTPLTNNIVHLNNCSNCNSSHISGINNTNSNSNILSNTPFSMNHDLNLDLFFNSPERFYRDIINESPVVSRTPHVGRTPLKTLNLSFSTPSFLKNMDANASASDSTSKNITPLKNQLFVSNSNNQELFQTPNMKKTIKHKNRGKSKKNSNHSEPNNENDEPGSSPTTIKISSSVLRKEENVQNKQIPLSPTPASKLSILVENSASVGHAIPKMGCFKKTDKAKQPIILPPRAQQQPTFSNQTSRFQIIMTDVTTFTNNSNKPAKSKKKKLARSSTVSNSLSKTITKKQSLKRSSSQPPTKFTRLKSQLEKSDSSLISNSGLSEVESSNQSLDSSLLSNTTGSTTANSIINQKQDLPEISVENIFDEKILSDTEKLLIDSRYF